MPAAPPYLVRIPPTVAVPTKIDGFRLSVLAFVVRVVEEVSVLVHECLCALQVPQKRHLPQFLSRVLQGQLPKVTLQDREEHCI